MRVSVPTIPHSIISHARHALSPAAAAERISEFLAPGNATVLTGAGVSVDSGIRAYRGKDGRYMNPNYMPIFYHQLVAENEVGRAFRQRYWLRSYLGYPPVRDALPNTTHFAIAALQHTSVVTRLITQNVDGLHNKALADVWSSSHIAKAVLELHGTLHRVRCSRGHTADRPLFQEWLSAANPRWEAFVAELEKTGQKPRTNPDGDVVLEGVSYDDFVVPDCPSCLVQGHQNNTHKPEVIFFGESIPSEIKERSCVNPFAFSFHTGHTLSFRDIEQCDRLLIMGTTLATFSAFRLLKYALNTQKPVLLLNVGPTRADGLAGIEKIEIPSGVVLRDVAKNVIRPDVFHSPTIQQLITNGITRPPEDDSETTGT